MNRKMLELSFIIIIMIGVITGCSHNVKTESGRSVVKVERIVDGDTFAIQLAGKAEKVRLIGMDTPETKKPNTPIMFYGEEASAYTTKRLTNQTISLEWDVERRDQYGRLLAYVWIGKELFNETLILQGYARLSTFPPNIKYVKRFTQDQKQAREQGNGIWQNYSAAFDLKQK